MPGLNSARYYLKKEPCRRRDGKPSKRTVVGIVNVYSESLKEMSRFPNICRSDEPVGLSRSNPNSSRRVKTAPGIL